MNVREVIASASAQKRSLLEPEAYQILASFGIPVLDYRLATSPEEAGKMAAEVGFPVVMKVVSPDVIHKTEAGGVKLNISDQESASRAYDDIIMAVTGSLPEAAIEGVLIAPMISGGIEVIMGMVRDPQFGPAVMFGLGGIFVEVLKDVVFEIAPVEMPEAERMIKSIKGYPLLAGARGSKPAHLKSLIDIVVGISRLSLELPEIKEIDLNPVLATPERSFVLGTGRRTLHERPPPSCAVGLVEVHASSRDRGSRLTGHDLNDQSGLAGRRRRLLVNRNRSPLLRSVERRRDPLRGPAVDGG